MTSRPKPPHVLFPELAKLIAYLESRQCAGALTDAGVDLDAARAELGHARDAVPLLVHFGNRLNMTDTCYSKTNYKAVREHLEAVTGLECAGQHGFSRVFDTVPPPNEQWSDE